MHIIIEEHQYPVEVLGKTLDGIMNLRDMDGKVSVSYVGYYYNPTLKDCVFILPKVLMEDVDGEELVFGHCKPEDIIDLEKQDLLTQEEHDLSMNFPYGYIVPSAYIETMHRMPLS